MAVDGNWKMTVNTPMGPQESTLSLSTSGDQLSGTQTAPDGSIASISDVIVDGNNISWKASITKPMSLTLEFSGTVDGDTLSGTVKLGMLGSTSFSGGRS